MSSDSQTMPSGPFTVNPTAVELVSFSATPRRNGIRLDWATATELDNVGFNLYRAESLEGERLRLNPSLIPAQAPGSPVGAEYTWLDATAQPGITYYYWLEDVDLYGRTTSTGRCRPRSSRA